MERVAWLPYFVVGTSDMAPLQFNACTIPYGQKSGISMAVGHLPLFWLVNNDPRPYTPRGVSTKAKHHEMTPIYNNQNQKPPPPPPQPPTTTVINKNTTHQPEDVECLITKYEIMTPVMNSLGRWSAPIIPWPPG